MKKTEIMEKFEWSLKNGEIDDVRRFVEEDGVDVNMDLDGRKPLHYAADFGHGTVVDYLIGKGAEINAKDKHDITPLLAAIFEGHAEVVRLMLEKGAEKHFKAPDGASYLDAAETEEIKAMLR